MTLVASSDCALSVPTLLRCNPIFSREGQSGGAAGMFIVACIAIMVAVIGLSGEMWRFRVRENGKEPNLCMAK